MQITSQGYILLVKDGVTISQHREVKEAVERASLSPGNYVVKFPDWGVSVPLSGGSQRDIYVSLIARLQATMSGLRKVLTQSAGTTGNNNPDGYAAATVTFYSNDFETEVSSDVLEFPTAILDMQWNASYGYSGGGWRAIPFPRDLGIGGNETNAGWQRSGKFGVYQAVDAVPMFVMSSMMYFSQKFLDDMLAKSEGYASHGMKSMDHRQYLLDGSGPDGSNGFTRWQLHMEGEPAGTNVSAGVYFSANAGGAGAHYYDLTTNVDLRTLADTWFWFCVVMDTASPLRFRVYIKRQTDTGVTKIIDRDGTVDTGGGEVLQTNGRGFYMGERTHFGYWDDIIGTSGFDTTRYMAIDRLRYANGWLDPPF